MSKYYTYRLSDGRAIKTCHPDCPARVLRGGRCPKGCPQKSYFGGCRTLRMLDHAGPDILPSGERCFVSKHHFGGFEECDNYKELVMFCKWHGLDVVVEEQPQGAPFTTHIIITESKKEARQ